MNAGRECCNLIARAVALLASLSVSGCATSVSDSVSDSVSPVRAEAGWFDCQENAECALTWDATCHLISANADHAEEVRRWIEYEIVRSGSGKCRKREIGYLPICENRKCSSARLVVQEERTAIGR